MLVLLSGETSVLLSLIWYTFDSVRMTFKAAIHSMSKTLPGADFDWGGTSPKQ